MGRGHSRLAANAPQPVNDERSNSNQRGRHVQQDHYRAQGQRQTSREPHCQARRQQHQSGKEHHPEEVFLAEVEAVDGRQVFVIIVDVLLHVAAPGAGNDDSNAFGVAGIIWTLQSELAFHRQSVQLLQRRYCR